MTEAGGLQHVDTVRLSHFVDHADLRHVVHVLRAARDTILEGWLDSVSTQPFHLGRRERAIADHIPRVFDRLLELLAAQEDLQAAGKTPAGDAAYVQNAKDHARMRASQGLTAADVTVEFRLLRHHIWAALRRGMPPETVTGNLIGAELLINDAIDGATGVSLSYYQVALEEALDDFVAIAAHDLGNPLTGIKGTIQLMARRAATQRLTPDMLAEGFRTMQEQANAMERLLRNMLDATRVRAGQMELHRAPTDLVGIVRHAIDLLGQESQERVVLVAAVDALVGNWEGDRIEQVAENLISNSLKYAPTGPVRVTIEHQQDTAILRVIDQGIGLTAEDHARLFQRYFRSPQVIERRVEGTGLGLFICRGIVEAHGGRITAISDGPNTGTTMTVFLPLGTLAGPS
ncbi:MAG: ATP-binding protein [Chloroflexota bacterium]